VLGCGAGGNQNPTEAFAAQQAIRAEIREMQKKQIKGGAATKKGDSKRGEKFRQKS
jgi:hypothetical protein